MSADKELPMIGMVQDYLPAAQAHEAVFRSILRDLQQHREKRPNGGYIPINLDPEESLTTLYEKYSAGNRRGIFTIKNFSVDGDTATFAFENVAYLSGGGAGLVYDIKGKDVVYRDTLYVMRS